MRFARRFVLLVPLGMAAAGLSVGNGRSAYQTPLGQIAVMTALAMVAACWLWAGRMLRLPEEQRVFTREPDPPARRRRGMGRHRAAAHGGPLVPTSRARRPGSGRI